MADAARTGRGHTGQVGNTVTAHTASAGAPAGRGRPFVLGVPLHNSDFCKWVPVGGGKRGDSDGGQGRGWDWPPLTHSLVSQNATADPITPVHGTPLTQRSCKAHTARVPARTAANNND